MPQIERLIQHNHALLAKVQAMSAAAHARAVDAQGSAAITRASSAAALAVRMVRLMTESTEACLEAEQLRAAYPPRQRS